MGWQAVDSCMETSDIENSSYGPCPVEALRSGDVGQRENADKFYATMNSYVRYFYEDDESGWGFSPFRQFKYPVSRRIVTKTVKDSNEGGDFEDISDIYINKQQTTEEKFKTFNSCRGLNKNTPSFEYQAASFNWLDFDLEDTDDRQFDVTFDLKTPEHTMVGQTVSIPVVVTNNSDKERTIQANLCTRSSYYTGNLGSHVKNCSSQFKLKPDQHESFALDVEPSDYEDKLVDMAFLKTIFTGFVQETGQSYAEELDFRFNKPCLKIEVSEMKESEECEAAFTFTNPLEVSLTDCFLTMEMSSSVRPKTIQIDNEILPHETFTIQNKFIPRTAGSHTLVACFSSRQLSDIIGHSSVIVNA